MVEVLVGVVEFLVEEVVVAEIVLVKWAIFTQVFFSFLVYLELLG